MAVVQHVFERSTELGRKRAHRVKSVDEAFKVLLADSQEFFFSELFLIAMDLAIQGRMREPGANPMGQISAASRLPVEASWLAALIDPACRRTWPRIYSGSRSASCAGWPCDACGSTTRRVSTVSSSFGGRWWRATSRA